MNDIEQKTKDILSKSSMDLHLGIVGSKEKYTSYQDWCFSLCRNDIATVVKTCAIFVGLLKLTRLHTEEESTREDLDVQVDMAELYLQTAKEAYYVS